MTTRRSLLGSTIALVALAAGCSRDGASSAAGPTSGSWGAAGTSARAASPTPAPTSAGSSAALVDPLPPGAVTMLLFGTDSRQKTSLSGNSDAIVLAQFSADRHHLSLVSIARDSHVAIPGMGKGKINAAFAQGGTPQLVCTVSQLLGGIHIPITVQANFTNFIALTRWMKGITVDNKHASTVKINSTGRVLDFHTGRLTLENTDALVYARERKSLPLGDLDRAERHRALVTGMVRGLQAADKASPQAFATWRASWPRTSRSPAWTRARSRPWQRYCAASTPLTSPRCWCRSAASTPSVEQRSTSSTSSAPQNWPGGWPPVTSRAM
ncbi:LCP family protein [Luteococcus sediminum]